MKFESCTGTALAVTCICGLEYDTGSTGVVLAVYTALIQGLNAAMKHCTIETCEDYVQYCVHHINGN
jgi:hypothetical protein